MNPYEWDEEKFSRIIQVAWTRSENIEDEDLQDRVENERVHVAVPDPMERMAAEYNRLEDQRVFGAVATGRRASRSPVGLIAGTTEVAALLLVHKTAVVFQRPPAWACARNIESGPRLIQPIPVDAKSQPPIVGRIVRRRSAIQLKGRSGPGTTAHVTHMNNIRGTLTVDRVHHPLDRQLVAAVAAPRTNDRIAPSG